MYFIKHHLCLYSKINTYPSNYGSMTFVVDIFLVKRKKDKTRLVFSKIYEFHYISIVFYYRVNCVSITDFVLNNVKVGFSKIRFSINAFILRFVH